MNIGFSRVDITTWEPGTSTMGWGHTDGVIEARSRLFVRAMVVRGPNGALAYACAELCIISLAVREAVIERLEKEHAERGLGAHNVVLSATHTHSGPNGYSHHLHYSGPSFGFSRRVFEVIVEGIVRAIVEAEERMEPGTLRVGRAFVPHAEPVAFNRSVRAYNENRDTPRVDPRRPELATRRELLLLRADDARGQALGVVCWFGVHGTSVHADNRVIHADNKGMAALAFEGEAGRIPEIRPDFVAIFAQEAAGDVTPSFRVDRRRGLSVGVSDDDFESARINGEIQYRHARRAFEAARSGEPLEGHIGGHVRNVDISDVEVHPGFADGRRGRRTHGAVVGLGMPVGTTEGPGPLKPFAGALERGSAWLRRGQRILGMEVDPKLPFLEVGRGVTGRFLGVLPIRAGFPFVAPREPMIAFMAAADRVGDLGDRSWVPSVVPIQVVRIGSLALAALPSEPTTVAGSRLRRAMADALSGAGVEHVVVNAYANGYSGYMTTREEYELQLYEGACTYFGPWTMAAYQTLLRDIARCDVHGGLAPVAGPAIDVPPLEELSRQRISGLAGVHAAQRPRSEDFIGRGDGAAQEGSPS